MPTYVYRREDGTTFEVFQRITDDALAVAPETGQAVERVIGGGAGLIFKGTGFYQTDYVRKPGSESGESKAESKAESKGTETSSAGAETKSTPASSDKSD